MRGGRFRELFLPLGTMAIVSVCFAVLRRSTGWTAFPPPWNDEIHFIIPGAPWPTGLTFDARASLNPDGIYWIPAGYPMFLASFTALTGDLSLAGIRLASAGLIAAAAAGLCRAFRALHPESSVASALAFSLAWAFTAPCVLASNIVRPEALVLALSLWSLVHALEGDWRSCGALAVIGACIHPLLAIPLAVQAWVALLLPNRARNTRLELALAVTAVLLLAVEAFRFAAHATAYIADWTFQLTRKGERPWSAWRLSVLIVQAGLALLPLLAAQRRAPGHSWIGRDWALATSAVGYLTVQAYGQEMWYTPFTATGVALGILLASSWALRCERFIRSHAPRLGTALMIGAAAFGWWNAWHKGRVQGISIQPEVIAQHAEDQIEVASLVSNALAETQGPLVVSSELAGSSIPQLLAGSLWTTNPRSVAAHGLRFSRAIYLERAFEQQPELARVLAGHVCISSERRRTRNGCYELLDLRLRPGVAGAAFRPCPPAQPHFDPPAPATFTDSSLSGLEAQIPRTPSAR